MTRIVAISDTHAVHNRIVAGEERGLAIPDGDILIHAGDFSFDYKDKPNRAAFGDFMRWLEAQPHKHKVLIAGNHDQLFERSPDEAKALMAECAPSVTYLQDSETNKEGLTIWGSPMTPSFFEWSFNRNRGRAIKAHWDLIPEKVDILVTHGPAHSICDLNKTKWDYHRCGCEELYTALHRVKPLVHIFGHVHGGYGSAVLNYADGGATRCYNVSVVNEEYRPTNPPTIIDL